MVTNVVCVTAAGCFTMLRSKMRFPIKGFVFPARLMDVRNVRPLYYYCYYVYAYLQNDLFNKISNSMAYEDRRFSAVFTRALQ